MAKVRKYAGECPACHFILVEGEIECLRCGTKFDSPAVRKTVEIKEKKQKCECPEDCICKCK